jgi:hypothetical protein
MDMVGSLFRCSLSRLSQGTLLETHHTHVVRFKVRKEMRFGWILRVTEKNLPVLASLCTFAFLLFSFYLRLVVLTRAQTFCISCTIHQMPTDSFPTRQPKPHTTDPKITSIHILYHFGK